MTRRAPAGERARRVCAAPLPIVAVLVVGLGLACAPTSRVQLPDRARAVIDPAAHRTIAGLAAACAPVRTMTANIGVAGRVGRQRVRATLLVGVARPGQVRIEAVAPFGAPVFIIAVDGRTATLVMPRDNAVITGVPVDQLLEALVQLPLTADDLAAVTLACPAGALDDERSRRHGDGTVSAADGAGIVAFARASPRLRVTGLLFAATPARQRHVAVAYPTPTAASRRIIDIEVGGASAPVAQLRLTLTDIQTNPPLGPTVFEVVVPAGAHPMTLDDLRRISPFAAASGTTP